MSSSENIAMFSSMTGTDADTAGVYLSMSNDNMEDAVNLFFNDPGLAAGMGAGSDVGVGGEGGMDTSESGVPVDLPVPPTDSGGGAAMRQPPMSPMSPMSPMGGQESDEAMAQRMAKEYAAMAGGGEDEVRRADDRKQDVLMGGGGMGGGGMGGYGGGYGGIGGVGGGLMDGGSAGFFDGGNAGNVQSTWTMDDEAPVGSASHSRDQTLSDMFAPPKHLCFQGPFQAARTAAKESKRWLLVNIQSEADFACHALNRDVWGDEMVQSLVTSGFIFWQQNSELSEAVTFIERYKVASYPHLSILDPRTGRQIWSKEGWTMESPVTAETFLEYVMDFGDKHSFDKPPAAPPAPAPSQSSSSSKSASPPPSNKRPITDLSEEEQLKAAMAASMQDSGDSGDSDGSVDMEEEEEEALEATSSSSSTTTTTTTTAVTSAPVPPAAPATMESILSSVVVADEASGPDTVRVQIRIAGVPRPIVRKFLKSALLLELFAFIMSVGNFDGKNFEVRMGHPPQLIEMTDAVTVDLAGVNGQALQVRVVEE